MPGPVIISDAIAQQEGGGIIGLGGVAGRLLESGLNLNALRTCDVLRKDEWKLFDDVLIEIARARLVGVADLFAAGLTFKLPDPLGTTMLEWEDVSDMDPAEISMSGVTEGQNDRVVYQLRQLPIPIVHKDFNINIRALHASRKRGLPLDTTQMATASRRVADLNESILFNGAVIVVGGATIQGYTTATNRNQGSLTGDWSLVGVTGEQIINDVIAMIGALTGDNHFGPYTLYIPTSFENKLNNDYKANSDKTIRTRIMEMSQISNVRLSTNLSDGGTGEVLLIEMARDVIDMVDGMQPTTLQWESTGGMITNFKVMSILVPRVKNDQLQQSGIAHYSV